MCLSRRGIAASLVAAAALLAASANSHAMVIPSVINAPLTLPGGQTHRLVTDTTIEETGTLVCEAGARVRAEPGKLLTVRGVLQAEGTRFFCPTGNWGGIEFTTTRSSESLLTSCVVENAGGAGKRAAILCEGTRTIFPAPSLIGCRIIRSAGDGVRSFGGAPMLKNCTISACAGIAVRNSYGGYVDFEPPLCTATGNRSNTVTFDRTGHGVIFPQEWKPAGFYYRILGDVGTRAGGTIIIRPGVELRMGNGVSLIADRRPIKALGTAASPIVIRGTRNWSGQWGGIFIKRGGAGSTFRHCDIRNGGARTCCCGKAPHLVAVGATRRGVRVENCKFRSGAGPGIYVENAIVSVTNSEVRNHADMGIVVLGSGQLTVRGSTIEANGRAGVYNGSSGAVVLDGSRTKNTLKSNGQYEVVNMSANDIPARRNDWGVKTARAIARRIYDGRDARGLGIVDFGDWFQALAASAADAAAPAFAITSAAAVPSNAGIVQITYALSAAGDVEAEVLNIAGRPVRRLAGQGEGIAGLNTLLWDSRSDSGLAVPAGRYIIRLRATSPDGAQAHATTTVMVSAQ